MKQIKISVLLFSVLVLLSCKEDESRVSVATFSGGNVSVAELRSMYNKLPEGERDSLKDRNGIFRLVRQLALEKIMLIKAREQKLDKTSDYLNNISFMKKKTGYTILEKKCVLDKIVITEDDYKKYNKTYELYQIVKRTDTLDENKIKNSRKLLQKLSIEIKDLESFQKYAREHSDDMTGSRDGFVGHIRAGIMDDEIDKVMRRIEVGKVSEIIETYAGYHLIYVNSQNEVDIDNLLTDKELHQTIYRNKKEYYENNWHEDILADKKMEIFFDKLSTKKYDKEIVIQFREKNISREEFFKEVDDIRQDGTFPEPTFEELKILANKMALKLAIENMLESDEITQKEKYIKKLEEDSNYLLINSYIDNNIVNANVSGNKIDSFYNENINTLFTFKDEKGEKIIQPKEEVEKFIVQKLENLEMEEARYTLYRKLVNDNSLIIYDKYLDYFVEDISK